MAVYVVNPSPVKVLYQVNGTAIQVGWPAKPNGQPYIVSAPLARNPATGSFNLGDNAFQAQFTDQEGSFSYPLSISGVSVDQDLVLYVFRGFAALMNQFGYVISRAGTPVPPPPPPP